MKKHGKIISVFVKEVTEGMHVVCYNPDLFKKVDRVGKIRGTPPEFFTGKIEVNCNGEIYLIHLKELKTLVVEYDEYKETYASSFGNTSGFNRIKRQISLKHSQWQKAIDNGEVDSGKIVEFEIVKQAYVSNGNKVEYAMEKGDYVVEYAKIIPNRTDKKMYSEEEVRIIIKKFAEYIDFDKVERRSIYRTISDQWFDSKIKYSTKED